MVRDWMSVGEAAGELGVSPRQVRNLVSSGALPGLHLGVAWLLPSDAVLAHSRRVRSPGPPLSAALAWAVMRVAQALLDRQSGQADAARVEEILAEMADRRLRFRVRQLLSEPHSAERWGKWMAGRADRQRVWVHPGVLDRLAADNRLRPGGGYAAAAYGVGIAASPPRRFYLNAGVLDDVLADYHAQDDVRGPVELLVVSSELLNGAAEPAGGPVPLVVALIDLLESDDARERHRAAEFLEPLALAAKG